MQHLVVAREITSPDCSEFLVSEGIARRGPPERGGHFLFLSSRCVEAYFHAGLH